MSAREFKQPKYRRHKASGRAFVQHKGRRYYLGKYGSEESWQAYYQKLNELRHPEQHELAVASAASNGLTIVELIDLFWIHAETWYRKHGQPTRTIENIRLALKPLKDNYGLDVAAEFGPLKLKALRETLIDKQLCRRVINDRIAVVKHIFKWGVENELIPGSTFHALAAVAGLQLGRSRARETKPVAPIEDAIVNATLPHLPQVVADMVRFQRLTGCRPGEVCLLRPCDVDRSGDVWEYRPQRHKTEHHGRPRVAPIGPRGQKVLRRYLARDAAAYCFSPADSEAKRHAELRLARRTNVQPSQRNRRRPHRRRPPRDSYTKDAYNRAIRRACDAAFPPPKGMKDEAELQVWRKAHRWHPNQLRHRLATEVRKQFGLEASQVVLGHAKADVTQVYALADQAKARSIMAQVG